MNKGSIIIQGGRPLRGEIEISGAKNSALPLMAACILAENQVSLHNVPDVMDVQTMRELLEELGIETKFERNVFSCKDTLSNTRVSRETASKMRASFVALGPLLARHKTATIALPGGCLIGDRPVNFHLEGLAKMGASIKVRNQYVYAETPAGLQGCTITLPQVSVGATQNIMMAACLANGETVIQNASQEPEVMDLIAFLEKMGAEIYHESRSVIRIIGVRKLNGCSHSIIPDRIETGTYAIAAAITGGQIHIRGSDISLLPTVNETFKEIGVNCHPNGSGTLVAARNPTFRSIKEFDITTGPYPHFPTDLQAQITALLSLALSRSSIHETLFENRFLHVRELNKMGANIQVHSRYAIIHGVQKLIGTVVHAQDLRGAAGLVLAGLAAEGTTVIQGALEHITRGYVSMIEKLQKCSAHIHPLTVEEVQEEKKL